jgi:transposase
LKRNSQKLPSKSDKLSDMELDRVNHLKQILPENWGKTPTSVKKLVEEMAQRIEQREQQLTKVLTVQEQLLEKINRTSKKSSPPSSDLPGFGKKPPQQKSNKKLGGQLSNQENSRNLYPIEEFSSVIDYHPEECASCGANLVFLYL